MTASDLSLLASLRLAPERGELWLAYQPQVEVATGRRFGRGIGAMAQPLLR
ncbi:MAG: hypothetical protein ACYDEN_07905 [Acidimicrobiales bacterium]